jgi:hypothetical protein
MLRRLLGHMRQNVVAWLTLSLIASALSLLAAPLAWAQAPPNDDFANATVISSLPFSETLDTSQATTEPTDAEALAACHNPVSSVSATVWYAYTPPEDQGVAISTSGSSYPTGVGVFTGGQGNLDALFCGVGGGTFSAVAGETYHIVVADIGGGNGGTLNIAATEFPFDFTVDRFGRFNARTGEATVTGTVTCPAGGSGFVDVSLTQRVGRTATVSGRGSADVSFDGTQQVWSATIQPLSGKFKGGHAAVVANAIVCAVERVERTIVLRH